MSEAIAPQPSDEQLKVDIERVHRENFGVYGIEKDRPALICFRFLQNVTQA